MLKSILKSLITIVIATPLVVAAGVAGILAFTAPESPPLMPSVEAANDPFAGFAREQPPAQFFTARDGARLAYHYYAGQPGKGVAVLIHGSSGSGLAMHGLARTLQAQGITVYAPDLRGHGQSPGPNGRLGDVVYRGQYDDDLADVSALITAAHPGEKRLLAGHSMGGAIILRTASQPHYAGGYDAYLALSPFISPEEALNKPSQGGWTKVSIPRVVVLGILNEAGISALDHLTVLAMAVPPKDAERRPRSYTQALLASGNLPRKWQPSIAAITKPTKVLIGADDEMFRAEAYPAAITAANPAIPVTLLPGIGHMTLTFDETALSAITATAVDMLK